jgi:hypothetical protein
MTDSDEMWVPEVCTLPTVDRPLRLAEFDDLFATALQSQIRLSPQMLRWTLDPEVEGIARDLTDRETQCCSFFSFDFTASEAELVVEVTVPPAQTKVLDALAARAAENPAA